MRVNGTTVYCSSDCCPLKCIEPLGIVSPRRLALQSSSIVNSTECIRDRELPSDLILGQDNLWCAGKTVNASTQFLTPFSYPSVSVRPSHPGGSTDVERLSVHPGIFLSPPNTPGNASWCKREKQRSVSVFVVPQLLP